MSDERDLQCSSCGSYERQSSFWESVLWSGLLYSTSTVPSRSSSTATSNRLVVSPSLLDLTSDWVFTSHTERQVVAASLTGGTCVESLEHDVGDSLRCQDIAGTDGRFRRGVQEAFLGYTDCRISLIRELEQSDDSLSRGTRHPAFNGMS